MKFKFTLVKVDFNYCDFLRKFDFRIPFNKNKKELRPFVGILFSIDRFEYFAPLTSPKAKHKKMRNTIDFFKIKNGELGAINFNNMIPVRKNNYSLIDLNNIENLNYDIMYQKLLKEQLNWLNKKYNQITNTAYKLYKKYNDEKLPNNIKNRCCNFKLLEEKSLLYNN